MIKSARMRHLLGAVAVTAAPLLLLGVANGALAADEYNDLVARRVDGTLPDGTLYQMIVPKDWDRTLISDLDAVRHIADFDELTQFLLSQGYAYAGTARREDRIYKFDPSQERDNQARVIDLFSTEFGDPDLTIQYGCSGGGGVALGIAELYPDRIDAAVAMNAADGLNMSNQRLDLLFALKATLAPESDLPLVGITYEDRESASEAWKSMLEAAKSTELGKARIALAGAIAQAPAWEGSADTDEDALVNSTIESAIFAAGIRYLYDNPAGVMSWNTDVDYQAFYNNAPPRVQEAVRDLYTSAGKNPTEGLETDLGTINSYPRIEGTNKGISYWQDRVLAADPGVPVLQITTAGDNTRWNGINAAYEAGVNSNDKGSLYRQAVVAAPGHCTESIAEIGAAILTTIKRVKTGDWADSTEPAMLNSVGMELGLTEPRFIDPGVLAGTSNRAVFPDSEFPKGE